MQGLRPARIQHPSARPGHRHFHQCLQPVRPNHVLEHLAGADGGLRVEGELESHSSERLTGGVCRALTVAVLPQGSVHDLVVLPWGECQASRVE